MGRPKRSVARRAGPNRREFFRRAGGAAFALGTVSLLGACGGRGDDDKPAPPAPPGGSFVHGVVSCASLANGFFNAYRRIAERADLDFVVHVGDYIYEHGNAQGTVRAYEPAVETVTLSDYRTRHAQYKRDADLQEMHRQHPMIAI